MWIAILTAWQPAIPNQCVVSKLEAARLFLSVVCIAIVAMETIAPAVIVTMVIPSLRLHRNLATRVIVELVSRMGDRVLEQNQIVSVNIRKYLVATVYAMGTKI
jgi:hypothetical protein